MTKNDNKRLVLKVKEPLSKDVGRAIARIDPEDMKALGLDVGDVIELEGKRKNRVFFGQCRRSGFGDKRQTYLASGQERPERQGPDY
jgi:transitional endoplasmic reticulum ATPase